MSKVKNNFIILMCSIILLSACAPAANYKPYSAGSVFTGEKEMGYRETEIEKGKWFVQYLASPSQDETDMVKFAVRRANEIGKNQCHGSYRKSEPTINSDSTHYIAEIRTLVTKKSVNITVTCQ